MMGIADVASLGTAPHKVRIFWTNVCAPEILEEASPCMMPPSSSLSSILHRYHVPSSVGHTNH